VRDEPGSNLQSVRRALRALELISESDCGVTELGRKLGVHKATASRLVATLAERGFVERDPITEKYRLGFGLISLAGALPAERTWTRPSERSLTAAVRGRTPKSTGGSSALAQPGVSRNATADLPVTVIATHTGEILRDLVLDPTRDYQPRGVKPGPPKGSPQRGGRKPQK